MMGCEINPGRFTEIVREQAKTFLGYGLKLTEGGPSEKELDKMVEEFARKLRKSGMARDVVQRLYDNAPIHLDSPGGHVHGVYKMGKERGGGALFTISMIPPGENIGSVELHEHKMPEYTILVDGALNGVQLIEGERTPIELLPLVPNKVVGGIQHSVDNPGHTASYQICIRAAK